MSIETTIAALERASAVVKAANGFAPARRGQFVIVEGDAIVDRRPSGRTITTIVPGFVPGIVSTVNQKGEVVGVRIEHAPHSIVVSDWLKVRVDTRGAIKEPRAVTRRLVDANGDALRFESLEGAVAAVREAAGIAERSA